MRAIVPVFAATLFAAPGASALGQGQSNCLDYLTADAALEKAAAPYRRAKSSADEARRESIRLAEAARREALNRARRTFQNGVNALETGPAKAERAAAMQKSLHRRREARRAANGIYKRDSENAGLEFRKYLSKYEPELRRAREAVRRASLARRAGSKEKREELDRAYRKSVDIYRNAERTMKAAGTKAGSLQRKALIAARSAHRKAIADANAAYSKANASANDVYRKKIASMRKPLEAAQLKAKQAAERRFLQSRNAAEETYRKAFAVERENYGKALKLRQDAYIEAYRKPERNVSRRVRGYDKAIVFKVAEYERRHNCPKL